MINNKSKNKEQNDSCNFGDDDSVEAPGALFGDHILESLVDPDEFVMCFVDVGVDFGEHIYLLVDFDVEVLSLVLDLLHSAEHAVQLIVLLSDHHLLCLEHLSMCSFRLLNFLSEWLLFFVFGSALFNFGDKRVQF